MSSKKGEGDPSGHTKSNIDGPGTWRPDPHSPIPIFAPCTVQADPETGTLRDATGSEVFECCASRCKPKYDYCTNICEHDLKSIYTRDVVAAHYTEGELMGRCIGNCRIMDTLCAQECRGMAPGFSLDNDYYDCATDNGCPRGLGQLPSKDCVEKNKDVIFKCCRSRCQPTTVTDCQELCETLQQTILDPNAVGLPHDMYPWARAIQDKRIPSPRYTKDAGYRLRREKRPGADLTLGEEDGETEGREGVYGDDSDPKKRAELKEAEDVADKAHTPKENMYPYLGASLGIGLIIALCIMVGIYLRRNKHK